MIGMEIRALRDGDRDWVRRVTEKSWGGPTVVVHRREYRPERLPGFVAVAVGERVGKITYQVEGGDLEIVTLVALRVGEGVGSALLDAAVDRAREVACRRVWLVTTNDNLRALRFYQRRGFRLVGISPGAVDAARRMKPEIPRTGECGIPVRDEIVLELLLEDSP
jgi:ribosomal protein S18 acetylase RimI-like enzyme